MPVPLQPLGLRWDETMRAVLETPAAVEAASAWPDEDEEARAAAAAVDAACADGDGWLSSTRALAAEWWPERLHPPVAKVAAAAAAAAAAGLALVVWRRQRARRRRDAGWQAALASTWAVPAIATMYA